MENPFSNVTGGTTNQKSVLASAAFPNMTGVSQISEISSVASSTSVAVGVSSSGMVTVAFPASFSPLFPFRTMEDTVKPLP